jgi:hypothetical protein
MGLPVRYDPDTAVTVYPSEHATALTLESFDATTYSYPIILATTPPHTHAMTARMPAEWRTPHDKFLQRVSRNSEDVKSIIVLMETEFPSLSGKISEDWIKQRIPFVRYMP